MGTEVALRFPTQSRWHNENISGLRAHDWCQFLTKILICQQILTKLPISNLITICMAVRVVSSIRMVRQTEWRLWGFLGCGPVMEMWTSMTGWYITIHHPHRKAENAENMQTTSPRKYDKGISQKLPDCIWIIMHMGVDFSFKWWIYLGPTEDMWRISHSQFFWNLYECCH